jgi:hypothetical protein
MNDMDTVASQSLLDVSGKSTLPAPAAASGKRDNEQHHGLSPLLQISDFGSGLGLHYRVQSPGIGVRFDNHNDFGG